MPPSRYDGNVWYGGLPSSAVNVNRLVAFVGQNDEHLPLLTVRWIALFDMLVSADRLALLPCARARGPLMTCSGTESVWVLPMKRFWGSKLSLGVNPISAVAQVRETLRFSSDCMNDTSMLSPEVAVAINHKVGAASACGVQLVGAALEPDHEQVVRQARRARPTRSNMALLARLHTRLLVCR